MTKKYKERFFKKEYPYDWWFVFDRKQEYVEDMKIPFEEVENLIPMSEDQVVKLLNEKEDYLTKIEDLKVELEFYKETVNKLQFENEQLLKKYVGDVKENE